jgi:Tol biopolymer transport system component
VYVMDADGSNGTRLTSGGGWDPVWSPDGRTIAYTLVRDGSAAIGVIPAVAGGSDPQILLNRPGYDGQPAWSPDGQTIVFVSDWRAYDFLYDLYAMDADGGNIRAIREGNFFATGAPIGDLRLSYNPVWSPDGRQLAFAACAPGFCDCFPGAIGVMEYPLPVGEGLDSWRALTIGQGLSSPTWSPDGKTIVFAASTCGQCAPDLRFVSLDGSSQGSVLTNGSSPAWRPNGPRQ